MQGLFGARSALTPPARRRSDTGVTSRRTVVSGGGWLGLGSGSVALVDNEFIGALCVRV
jgi:hypothetical protein